MKLHKTIELVLAGLVGLGLGVSLTIAVLPQDTVGGDSSLRNQNSLPLSSQEIDFYQAISRLMVLPEEQPVYSVVTNAQELRDEQSFYELVIDGDVLAIFPQNSKAIIYRPSTDQLVNVGPLFLEQIEE